MAGTIIVTKDAGSDGETVFTFSAGGGLSPISFTLTGGTSHTFSSVPAGSGYSIIETPASGWEQTSVTVSNSSKISNITVADLETVTVTFKNAPYPSVEPPDWLLYQMSIKPREEDSA